MTNKDILHELLAIRETCYMNGEEGACELLTDLINKLK